MAFRRVNRQIEVFDISLMAVVTKAMGAFLVLMILLMPYYRSAPAYQKPAEDIRRELDSLRKRLAEMQQNLGRFKEDPEPLKRELAAALEQIDRLKVQITGLERQLDQAWAQVTRLQNDVTKLEALRQQLEAEKAALAEEKAKAEQVRDELDKRLSAVLPLFDSAAAKSGIMAITRLNRDVKCLKLIPEDPEERARVRMYTLVPKDVPGPTPESTAIMAKLTDNAGHHGTVHGDAGIAKAMAPRSKLVKSDFQYEESISYSIERGHNQSQVFIVVDLPREGAACDAMASLLLIIFDSYIQPLTLPTVQSSTTRPVKRLLAVLDLQGFPEDLVREPTGADVALLKEKFKIDVDISDATTSAPDVKISPPLAPSAP